MPRFTADALRAMCAATFEAVGFAPDDAGVIARLMVEANLVGHDSHGVRHIPVYVERVRNGLIVPDATLSVKQETAATAVLEGGNILGHVAATRGMEMAIKKARHGHIAAVAVRHQEHVGRVGAYPELAAQAGLVGVTFCNGQGRGVQIAPFGGISRRMGANPIAAAFPNAGGHPVLLDVSTSQVAVNKVRQARDREAQLPDGTLISPSGEPSGDPETFLRDGGAVLPLGGVLFGHKGFGLAVMVDLFAGLLGGSGTALNHDPERLNNGTFHIAINPRAFMDEVEYSKTLLQFANYLRDSPVADGAPAVQMPGDFEAANRAERVASGIPVDEAVWERICATLAELSVVAPKPL